jgi:nicotinate-nucleotide adenylyltransferase
VRIAVYGGSFNPPHVAHGMVAAWLRWTGQVDQVWLVPVFRHAFEGVQDKSLAPFEVRLEWCRALVDDLSDDSDGEPCGLEVLDIERDLPHPNYSIQTLEHLERRHPEHHLRLVVGGDVLDQLPRWKDWDQIEARFRPLVVGRAGFPVPAGSLAFPEVSSTDIRRRLAAGESVEHLLTRRVRAQVDRDAWSGS